MLLKDKLGTKLGSKLHSSDWSVLQLSEDKLGIVEDQLRLNGCRKLHFMGLGCTLLLYTAT